MATAKKIQSNNTGLSYAEETSIGVVPSDAIWYDEEPNSHDTFGASYSMVSRTPIQPGRQNKRGTITDTDTAVGYNTDFTQTNLHRLFQGALFADAREVPTTKPLNLPQVLITSASSTDDSYNAAGGLTIFSAGDLVTITGFNSQANVGMRRVVSSTSTKLIVDSALVDEAGSSKVVIQKVGVQLASGDAALTVDGEQVSLELTAGTFAGMQGIIPGAWVYVGGDAEETRFEEITGYCRIGSVSAKKMTFDSMITLAGADDGAGKTIQIFVGTLTRNEKDPELIKLRTYQFERSLGKYDPSMGVQTEYGLGCGLNELTTTIATADKITVDLAFVGTQYETRDGSPSQLRKTGTHVPAASEACFNTSSNIPLTSVHTYSQYRSKQVEMYEMGESYTVGINNNISGDKAIGILGSFDLSYGNIDVTVSLDAYFATVEAQNAIRRNAPVGASCIAANANAGFVLDVPLGTLSGGELAVELGEAVKTSVEFTGAENRHGYTMQYQTFSYLPNTAMIERKIN